METLEVYQKFFTDIWQLLQKVAGPIGIGCLVLLLVGVLELYITTKQRLDMLVYSVFAFVFFRSFGFIDCLLL